MPNSARSVPQVTASSSTRAGMNRLSLVTATIAHEVNQPLSGIMTNASACLRMLSADPPNLEGARDTMMRTLRDVNRAAAVLARMRALFVRPETVMQEVDLNEIVCEALVGCQSELTANHVTVALNLADGAASVSGDAVQLQQVVTNLIRNASDAMSGVHGRPRTVTITVRRVEDGAFCIDVKDRGIGIDVSDLEKIFTPFYTTKSRGMGIGLSISRSIVQQHRGDLWGAPNRDGPGATFSVTIPRMAVQRREPRRLKLAPQVIKSLVMSP